MKTKMILSVFSVFVIALSSCTKENGQSTLAVRLTDAPVDAEEVNIDLKEVKINFDKDTASWITVQTTPGVYNLLGLQNGIDSLIAQGSYPSGQVVKEIRLVVGASNTIKVNGQLYPLTIPSGAESGLKIKVNKKLQATVETLLLDFDAALSIKEENDGYKLRPVVKLK